MQIQELNLTDAAIFEEEVRRRIADDSESVTVFIVDMTGVNKLFAKSGRAASAIFLRGVAKMLQRICRDNDLLCRIGDCTFGILLENADSAVLQQLAAEKIIRLYEAALDKLDVTYNLGLHIGIASFPKHASDAGEVIQNARIALEAASIDNDPYQIYTTESHNTMTMKWSLQADLAKAIEDRALHLVYQPKISLKTGRPIGAEALLRWTHEEHGAVSPAVFIPVACQIGLIDDITNFVLVTALGHAAEWPNTSEECSLSVNLEAQMLELPDIVASIKSNLSIWGNERVDLILEITESALVTDSRANFERLNQLRLMGVGISVDDFGTGYSSLSYFKNIPATELKVDRSFVTELHKSSRNRNLVETIISLAHGFGLTVVAEGVETEEELEALKAMGCDAAQGFFIAKPLSHEQFCQWLAKNRGPDEFGIII